MNIRTKWNVYKQKALYTKTVYSKHFVHYDEFSSSFDDRYKFEYDITILKCYTLSGVIWRIEMPNCFDHDKNLYRLIVRGIEYAATEFPQYFRLRDKLLAKDLFNKLP